MSYTVGAPVKGAWGATAAPTVTSDLVAGETVLVSCASDDNTKSLSSVTDNATTPNTYTLVGRGLDSFNGNSISLFYSVITTSKTGATITGTMGASVACAMSLQRCTGLGAFQAGVGRYQSSGVDSTADSISTGNMTPSSQPAVVFGVMMDEFNGSVSAGTGFTDDGSLFNTAAGRTEHMSIASTSPVAATFTRAVSHIQAISVGAVFTDGSGGGGGSSNSIRNLIFL